MKETIGSLRAYLIIVGLVGGAQNAVALSHSEHILASVLFVLGLGVALSYVVVGVALRPILSRGPLPFTLFLIACTLWIGLTFLIGLLVGQVMTLMLVGGVLVNLYILVNGRRLARALQASPAPGAAAPGQSPRA